MEKKYDTSYWEMIINKKPDANWADSRVYLLKDENLAIKIYHPKLTFQEVQNYYEFLNEFRIFLENDFSNLITIPNFWEPQIYKTYDKHNEVSCLTTELELIRWKEFTYLDFSNTSNYNNLVEILTKENSDVVKEFLNFLKINKCKDLKDLFSELVNFFILKKYWNWDLSKKYLCKWIILTHSNIKYSWEKFIITDVDSIPSFLQTIKTVSFFSKS